MLDWRVSAAKLASDRGGGSAVKLIAAMLAAIIGTAGCNAPPAAPATALHRLADLLAAGAGHPEPPAVAVGDTTRYVIGDRVALGRGSVDLAALENGEPVRGEFRCPPGYQRRRVQVMFHGEPPFRLFPITHLPPPVQVVRKARCPRNSNDAGLVSFGALPPPPYVRVWAEAVVLSRSDVVSSWVDIPADASLVAHAGISATPGRRGARGGHFAVWAEGASGERIELFDRRVRSDPDQSSLKDRWDDVVLPLGPARRRLGDRMRFHFIARTAGRTMRSAVWGDPTVMTPPRAVAERRRNLIIISLDTMRADRLGTYGFTGGTSWFLDRVAAGGTTFTNAVTLANWTLPSHATMLTGAEPCVHGFRGTLSFASPETRALPRGIPPLAETLRQHGWRTVAFTEGTLVEPGIFQRGFEQFYADPRWAEGAVADTYDAASRWLRANADSEFFLFFHTYQVHFPYAPPERYRRAFDWSGKGVPHSVDAAEYTGEVAYTDEVMGRLFGLLDELELTDRTIVVVTSDHGEAFGEHGNESHGTTLYEEEIHVPLIWRAPGLIAAGLRVDGLSSVVDIVPTALSLLNLPAPSPLIAGIDLSNAMRVDRPRGPLPGDRVLVIEGMGGRAFRGTAWKAIEREPASLYFSLPGDPQELQRAERALFGPALRTSVAHDARCADLAAKAGRSESSPALDPEREERLRALGYLR